MNMDGSVAKPNPARACYSKVMYKDVRAAKMAIRKYQWHLKERLRYYKCQYCPGYHLTKKPNIAERHW